MLCLIALVLTKMHSGYANMKNWDDLKMFVAVAQAGSLTAAAEALGVNQSTVSRRINSFEKELDVRLFERFSTGYVLTAEGEELLYRARRIEEEMYAIDRHVMGKNIALSGPIRVTSSLVIALYFLIPMLGRFHDMHPDIVVHLDLSNSLYNLTAREADLAIRVTRDAIPETLIARQLGLIKYGVYGQTKYLRRYLKKGGGEDGGDSGDSGEEGKASLHWVGEDGSDDRPKWLPSDLNPLRLVARSNDVLATRDLLKQGMGVGRLPSFMGDSEKKLQQLELSRSIPAVPIWLLSHADMRRVSRISVFTAFLVEEFRQQLGYAP